MIRSLVEFCNFAVNSHLPVHCEYKSITKKLAKKLCTVSCEYLSSYGPCGLAVVSSHQDHFKSHAGQSVDCQLRLRFHCVCYGYHCTQQIYAPRQMFKLCFMTLNTGKDIIQGIHLLSTATSTAVRPLRSCSVIASSTSQLICRQFLLIHSLLPIKTT